jgi:hypothetical protein
MNNLKLIYNKWILVNNKIYEGSIKLIKDIVWH